MSHDSTTLVKAINKWLKKNCKVGYGHVYCGALLDDFEEFCSKTGAMKASPGHSAFGREMSIKGFGRRRVNGLQHITGLVLKKSRRVVEHRTERSVQSGVEAAVERKSRQKDVEAQVKGAVKDARDDAAVKRRMKKETKQHAQDAGKVDA